MPDRLEGVEVDLHQRDLTEELSGYLEDLKWLKQEVSIQTLWWVHTNSDNFDAARNNAINNMESDRAAKLAANPADATNINTKYDLLISEENKKYNSLSNHFGTIQELHPRLETKDGELKLFVSIPRTRRKQRKLIRRLEREHNAWQQTEQNMWTAAAISMDTKLHKLMTGVYTNILWQLQWDQVDVSKLADGAGRIWAGVEWIWAAWHQKLRCNVDGRYFKKELPSLMEKFPYGTEAQKNRWVKVATLATWAVMVYGAYQALFGSNKKNRQAAWWTYWLAALGMYIHSGSIKAPWTIVKEILWWWGAYDTISWAMEKMLGLDPWKLSWRTNISNVAALVPAVQVSQVVQHLSYENLKKYTKNVNWKVVLADKSPKDDQADLAVYLKSIWKDKESQIVQMMYEQQWDDNILDKGLSVMWIDLAKWTWDISESIKIFDDRVALMNKFLDDSNVDLQKSGIALMERYYRWELTLQQTIQKLQKWSNMLLDREWGEPDMWYINYFVPESQQQTLQLIGDLPKELASISTSDFTQYIDSGYINGATTVWYVSIDRSQMESDALPSTNALLKGVSTPAARRELEQSLTSIFAETLNFDFNNSATNLATILGSPTMWDFFETQTYMLQNMQALWIYANNNKLMPGPDTGNEISNFIQTNHPSPAARLGQLNWMRLNGWDVFEYNGLWYSLEWVIADPTMQTQLAGIATLPDDVKEWFVMRWSHYKQNLISTWYAWFSPAGANEINRHSHGKKITINRQTKELTLASWATESFDTQTIPELMQFAHYINSTSLLEWKSNDHTPRQWDGNSLEFQRNNSALEWLQDMASGMTLGSRKDGWWALDEEMLSKEWVAKNYPTLLVWNNGQKLANLLNAQPGRQVLESADYFKAKEIEVNKQLATLNGLRWWLPTTSIKIANWSNFVLTASMWWVTKEVMLNVRDLTVGKYWFFPIGRGDIEAATTAADKYLQAKLAIDLVGRIKSASSATKRAAITSVLGVDGFLKWLWIDVWGIATETWWAIKAVMERLGDDARQAVKDFGEGTWETLWWLFDIVDFGFDWLVSKPISALWDLLD